jgi:uncharacterized protein YaaW (UPF0174 family)
MKSSDDHREDFFERFDEAYEELLMYDGDEARAFLVEEGYDLEAGFLIRKKISKKLEFKLTALYNRQKDESLLEKAYEKLQVFISKNRELAGDELKILLQKAAPAYQFRNLEKLDDDGIRELLTEVDLVKFIEDLDNEEKR